MYGGMFEMTVGSEGLKHFSVDSPAAATEWMDEQRRYRAELEMGGVEVDAFSRHRCFDFSSLIILCSVGDAALVLDTNSFDDSHQAICDGPIDFRQVPPAKLLVRFGGDAAGISLCEPLGWRCNSG